MSKISKISLWVSHKLRESSKVEEKHEGILLGLPVYVTQSSNPRTATARARFITILECLRTNPSLNLAVQNKYCNLYTLIHTTSIFQVQHQLPSINHILHD